MTPQQRVDEQDQIARAYLLRTEGRAAERIRDEVANANCTKKYGIDGLTADQRQATRAVTGTWGHGLEARRLRAARAHGIRACGQCRRNLAVEDAILVQGVHLHPDCVQAYRAAAAMPGAALRY